MWYIICRNRTHSCRFTDPVSRFYAYVSDVIFRGYYSVSTDHVEDLRKFTSQSRNSNKVRKYSVKFKEYSYLIMFFCDIRFEYLLTLTMMVKACCSLRLSIVNIH